MSTSIDEARQPVTNCNNEEPTWEICRNCTQVGCDERIKKYGENVYDLLHQQNKMIADFLPI